MFSSCRFFAIPVAALALTLTACTKEETPPVTSTTTPSTDNTPATNDDHADGADHGHEETPIGTVMIGDMEVACSQGHGTTEAGKEMHLIVKLPYNDSGATIVRAWIGTEDRLSSFVARGEYAASHDDYDIHVEAPDPLPDNAQWWIEVEKPDGTKDVGSIDFL